MALRNHQRSHRPDRPPASLFGLRRAPANGSQRSRPNTPVIPDAPVAEVPQPRPPSTPVIPDAPVTPADPDPGTPADPERPATVPDPDEPATPVIPDPSEPPEPAPPPPDPGPAT